MWLGVELQFSESCSEMSYMYMRVLLRNVIHVHVSESCSEMSYMYMRVLLRNVIHVHESPAQKCHTCTWESCSEMSYMYIFSGVGGVMFITSSSVSLRDSASYPLSPFPSSVNSFCCSKTWSGSASESISSAFWKI